MKLKVINLCLCMTLLMFVLTACQTKVEDKHVPQSQTIIQDQKEKLDILAVGNSDLYSGFNPLQLWHEKGYTSFVAGAPMQNMKLSYEMVKLAFKYHTPKVLILEVDQFFDAREKAIEPQGYEYTAKKYSYPLLKNTNEFEDIQKEKYYSDKGLTGRMNNQGYYYNNTIKPYHNGFSYMNSNKKNNTIVSFTKTYLPKIVALTKENNCEVLLVWLPSQTTATQKRHEIIQSFVDKYDLTFIDFNVEQYNTGFDWETDSRDAGNHLNYNGACKMTKFLGEYLSQNYQLNDNRQQSSYQRWNEMYKEFIVQIENNHT